VLKSWFSYFRFYAFDWITANCFVLSLYLGSHRKGGVQNDVKQKTTDQVINISYQSNGCYVAPIRNLLVYVILTVM